MEDLFSGAYDIIVKHYGKEFLKELLRQSEQEPTKKPPVQEAFGITGT